MVKKFDETRPMPNLDDGIGQEEYKELHRGFKHNIKHSVTVEFGKAHYFIYGVSGLIILILIFLVVSQSIHKDKDLLTMYNFQSNLREEMVPYEKRKELFITKAMYIMKSAKYGKKCTFTEQEKFDLASKVFDMWQETHISGFLFLASAYIESGFNNYQHGEAGEITYLQFMPPTWNEVTNGSRSTGSEHDITYVATMWYRMMQDLNNYLGDTKKALLAYNCGLGFTRYYKTKAEIASFKTLIYHGKEAYDDKVYAKYLEFVNLDSRLN